MRLVSEGKIAADASLFGDALLGEMSERLADVFGELRLVPKFNERDPDVFFGMFERLVEACGWSDTVGTLLLQCVLTGKRLKRLIPT